MKSLLTLTTVIMADEWPAKKGHVFYSSLFTTESNVYINLQVGTARQVSRMYLNTNLAATYIMSKTCKERSKCNVMNPYGFDSAKFVDG